jgi:hypothetical protein
MPPTTKCATRLALVLLLAAVCTSLVGCGGGTVLVTRAQLQVENAWFSFQPFVAIEAQEVFGPGMFFYDVLVFPGSSAVVDLPPGTYDVTIYWDDGGLETYLDVDVYSGTTTYLRVSR